MESKSSFWASKSLSPGLIRSQSMNASEFSMTDVNINQPPNVYVTDWQDHTLKRTYDTNVVTGSNQLETASSKFYVSLYIMCDQLCTFTGRKTILIQVLKGDVKVT